MWKMLGKLWTCQHDASHTDVSVPRKILLQRFHETTTKKLFCRFYKYLKTSFMTDKTAGSTSWRYIGKTQINISWHQSHEEVLFVHTFWSLLSSDPSSKKNWWNIKLGNTVLARIHYQRIKKNHEDTSLLIVWNWVKRWEHLERLR